MSRKRMQRWGSARSVTAGVALALLLVAPVEANWLARGSAVLGVGHSLKRNLGEGIDLMGEALDAAIHGDAERMREIGEEIEALPGRLVRDAFPVFKLGAAVRDATAAAGEKLKSAAGRIPRLRSEALGSMESSRERLRSVPLKVRRYYGDADEGGADPRMALAVDEEERALFGADTRTSDEPALAAEPAATATGDGDAEAGASAASGWDDVVGSEEEDEAVQAVAQGSDPWAADEGGTGSSGWDEEPASGGMQVARVEVEDTPSEDAIEDDGGDYTSALNELLSGDASAGVKTSARSETVTRKPTEAATKASLAEGRTQPDFAAQQDVAEVGMRVAVDCSAYAAALTDARVAARNAAETAAKYASHTVDDYRGVHANPQLALSYNQTLTQSYSDAYEAAKRAAQAGFDACLAGTCAVKRAAAAAYTAAAVVLGGASLPGPAKDANTAATAIAGGCPK